jgi:hypothetical protein
MTIRWWRWGPGTRRSRSSGRQLMTVRWEEGEPWYKEVQELRKAANDY